MDLDAGHVSVVRTVIQTRSAASIGEPRTARGRQPIALDEGTVQVLREHRWTKLEERLLVGSDLDDDGLVVDKPDGTWPHPDAMSEAFLRRVNTYGLPRISLRGLRRPWTIALGARDPPARGAGAFRHLTISITLGIDSHVGSTLHDDAAEQIAGLVL